jgi:tetraacyldisaccharide 4'-kinase
VNPLSAIYGAVVGARNALYDGGTFRARRLKRPVISIGNISVGGTGKTPFTILLGELLQARGITVDVLSRGYRRQTSGVRVVDPQGRPEEFGDEPVLMARRLGVPVIVGESRYAAGELAEERFQSQVHLLDDGFQHRQLARAFDIVLVGREDLHSGLLPTGRLREPVASLKRADAVVVEEGFDVAALGLRAEQAVWRVRRGIRVAGASARPIAFCGIGKPKRFFEQLRAQGIKTAAEIEFRDHHRYSDADVRRLTQMMKSESADGFVTTAKDEINLGKRAAGIQPLAVAEVAMELLDAERAMSTILSKVLQ